VFKRISIPHTHIVMAALYTFTVNFYSIIIQSILTIQKLMRYITR